MEYGPTDSDKKLVLFTNSYPYGQGETFLHDELPFLSAKFGHITIFPLYRPKNGCLHKAVPRNVSVKEPLLGFDHKDKKHLLLKGVFNGSPLFFCLKELFSRRVIVSCRNMWIFFNYLLILRAVLGNRKKMRDVIGELEKAEVAYFYWGDKSALIIPFVKRKMRRKNAAKSRRLPKFVVRFHGSDLYEHAKGYLPFRQILYPSVDYAVPISRNGAEYIESNYPYALPKNIVVYRLGSINPFAEREVSGRRNVFRIVSCSNVIELKRVSLIARALGELGRELESVIELAEHKMDAICWTHIGDGPLLKEVKRQCAYFPPFIKVEFKGALPHEEVLEYYHHTGAELFIQVSRSEGVPVSIMEALSFGIPVVATNVGGVGEIVEEECGTLLPANVSALEIKEAIIKYINLSNEQMKAMRNNAVALWQRNWSAENNYRAFACFLENL